MLLITIQDGLQTEFRNSSFRVSLQVVFTSYYAPPKIGGISPAPKPWMDFQSFPNLLIKQKFLSIFNDLKAASTNTHHT